LAVALLVTGVAVPAGAALIAGQVDTFEDGGLLAWQAGITNPNAPVNVSTGGPGGPGGAGDNFLRLSSNGGSSAGGKLVAFNTNQWAGDYIDAGVDAIRMEVNNQGPTSLTLRLIFVNNLGQTATTITGVNISAGSGWIPATFPLTPDNLTGGTLDPVISNVLELNLVHSPTVISARSSAPNVVAQLGVDNITAVPEPSVTLSIVVAALATGSLRRRAGRTAGMMPRG
jgi:hypothetical protein